MTLGEVRKSVTRGDVGLLALAEATIVALRKGAGKSPVFKDMMYRAAKNKRRANLNPEAKEALLKANADWRGCQATEECPESGCSYSTSIRGNMTSHINSAHRGASRQVVISAREANRTHKQSSSDDAVRVGIKAPAARRSRLRAAEKAATAASRAAVASLKRSAGSLKRSAGGGGGGDDEYVQRVERK